MTSEAPAQLLRLVQSQYYVSDSGGLDPLVFKSMTLIIALIIALYLFGVSKQLDQSRIWVAHVDSKGYWHPNVNIVVPIFATAHGIALSVALASMSLNFGGPVRAWTLQFEGASFLLLHCLNWSKTWVTLYAMPHDVEGPNFAHPCTGLSTRFASPYLFNTLVFFGYAAPLLIAVPLLVLQARSMSQAHQDYESFLKVIEMLRYQIPENASLITWLLNPTVALKIQNLKSGGEEVHRYGKLFAITLIIFHSISILFLLWAKQAILRTLFNQVKIYRRCIWNRRQVLGMEAASTGCLESEQANNELCLDKAQTGSLESQADRFLIRLNSANKHDHPAAAKRNFIDWKVLTPCLQPGTEVGAELWKSDLMRRLDEKDQALQSNLEVQYLALRQYTANTMWQALLICIISGSYITLGLGYVFNWPDAPIRISYPQLCLDQLKYAGIIWTVGGFFLASLTAIVASSKLPNAASHQTLRSDSEERQDSTRFEIRHHTERTLPFQSHAF